MQKLKKSILLLTWTAFVFSCGSKSSTSTEQAATTENTEAAATTESTTESAATAEANPSYDPKRGEGKWNAENVALGASLDAAMAGEGEKVSGVKCFSCHKTSDEKLVGPGWKGVTSRRKPEWIMNFITNPDPMIDKDPEVQAQLELCLVRMPNQGLEDKEARDILEFMRKNDGAK
jgi:mono/diheme cytochrome c family protein